MLDVELQRLGRSVVHDDHLVRRRILPQDAVERLGEVRRPAVDGQDDADAHRKDSRRGRTARCPSR
jgi:hypothetical protein